MNLDDLLPIRDLYVNGTLQRFTADLNFDGSFTATITQNIDGTYRLNVSVAADAVLEGSNAMGDGDYNAAGNVIPTAGKSYVGCTAQFTADRAFWLPPDPETGTEVTWADECVTGAPVGGALANHNLIVKTSDGTEIMGGVTGQTGGNTLAATYTAEHAAWGTGATITFFFNGTFWKIK